MRGDLGEALGERLAWTGRGITKEAAYTQVQLHGRGAPRQIGQGAPGATMDAEGRLHTVGTARCRCGGGHLKGEVVLGRLDRLQLERSRGRQKNSTQVMQGHRSFPACAG